MPIEKLIKKQTESLSSAQVEEIDKMKLQAKTKKSTLSHELNEMGTQIKAVEYERCDITNNRLKLLALDKRLTLLKQDFMKRQENQFFAEMQIDMELEKQIKEFTEKEKLTAKVVREFVVMVK